MRFAMLFFLFHLFLVSFAASAQIPSTGPVAVRMNMPSTAATPALAKQTFHVHEKAEKEYGYASAVRIGDTLYVSGSPGTGPMNDALRRAYTGLKAVLAQHGLDFRHVVKETLYATDLDAVAANNAVRLGFYNGEMPAATWVGVTRLLMPTAVVEVEVVAVFPAQ
jgi:2-iminobutanoate/2-iminopropanoate deaminase